MKDVLKPILIASRLLLLAPLVAVAGQGDITTPQKFKTKVAFIEGKPMAEVIRMAKAEKKPILLDVYATWCGPCKMMDRTTFSDTAIADWLAKTMLPAKFDAEMGDGRRVATRYAVRAFPTVLVLNPDGTEIDRLSGAYNSAQFREQVEQALAKRSGLQQLIEKLKTTWEPDNAAQLVNILASRNDLARLRPIALRLIDEDPDLARPTTVDAFIALTAIEDASGKMSPETADYVATYISRLGSDPRRGTVFLAYAHELSRRGDLAELRKLVVAGNNGFGENDPVALEILATLGTTERRLSDKKAAVTLRRAMSLTRPTSPQLGLRQLELAEALAETPAGAAEAKTLVEAVLQKWAGDSGALARSSRVMLKIKAPKEALGYAQKAVTLSQGEDAEAQAALAICLLAGGDNAGALLAWKKASEIDPDNSEYKKSLKESQSQKKG